MVYAGYDYDEDYNYGLYLYTGEETIKISESPPSEELQISDGQVVWQSWPDDSIYLYDGEEIIQLSESGYSPQISQGQAVWESPAWLNPDASGIYLYNGEEIIQLSESGRFPQISDGQVVWEDNYDIYLYNGEETVKLAEHVYNHPTYRSNEYPQISHGCVTWVEIEEYAGYNHTISYRILLARPVFPATVDIQPDKLNLQSNQAITAQITPPEGYTLDDINLNSIRLAKDIVPEDVKIKGGVVVAKFSRSDVQYLLEKEGQELVVTGKLTIGAKFTGSDTIETAGRLTPFAPTEYEVIQLTDGGGNGGMVPKVSRGQVTWSNYNSDVYLYDGNEIIRLGDVGTMGGWPDIDDGQVVWAEWGIMLYNGEETIQLTTDRYNSRPQISDGQVVWMGNGIYLYDGEEIIKLADGSNRYPKISNGQVVWIGGYIGPLYLYDGEETIRIEGDSDACYANIDDGQVAWYGWDGSDYEIYLYDGEETIQLTDNSAYDYRADISQGQVVWVRREGEDYRDKYGKGGEIYLYDGEKTIKLADYGGDPAISNGQVVWAGYDGNDYEIYLYNGEETIQLTDNDYDDVLPHISEGCIVWSGNGQIFLARPVIGARVEFTPRTYDLRTSGNLTARVGLPMDYSVDEVDLDSILLTRYLGGDVLVATPEEVSIKKDTLTAVFNRGDARRLLLWRPGLVELELSGMLTNGVKFKAVGTVRVTGDDYWPISPLKSKGKPQPVDPACGY